MTNSIKMIAHLYNFAPENIHCLYYILDKVEQEIPLTVLGPLQCHSLPANIPFLYNAKEITFSFFYSSLWLIAVATAKPVNLYK